MARVAQGRPLRWFSDKAVFFGHQDIRTSFRGPMLLIGCRPRTFRTGPRRTCLLCMRSRTRSHFAGDRYGRGWTARNCPSLAAEFPRARARLNLARL